MDCLSWILTFAVVGYTTALTVKTGGAIYRYHKAKDRTVRVSGEVSDWLDIETVRRNGNKISTFYPVYTCTINGGIRTLNGSARWAGNPYEIKGWKVNLIYDRETEELWCEEDLPLMKKQIKIRLATVFSVLALMILTRVLL